MTSESAVEDALQEHLLAGGWLEGDPSGYAELSDTMRPNWLRSWRRRSLRSSSGSGRKYKTYCAAPGEDGSR